MSLQRSIACISLFAVSSIVHAQQVDVTLDNGDLLKAELVSQTDKTVILQHPVLGKLVIDKSKISLMIDDAKLKQQAAEAAASSTAPAKTETTTGAATQIAAKQPEQKPVDDGLFGTGFLTNWSRRLDVGVAGSAGKTKSSSINLGFTSDFTNKYTRITSKTAYFRSQSDGTLTANSAYSALDRDWLRPESPWFEFAGGRADWDQFNTWRYRVAANGGMGYEFVNNDTWLIDGRSGLGFSQTFGGDNHKFTPEGLLGFEAKWHVNNHQKIHFINSFYPALDNLSQFRNLTSLDWILDLNTLAGVALKLGLTNEYDSRNNGDLNRNDFKYTASLAWTL